MKVKICGLRREEDINYVNELKPDYVGFVFAKSKRQVTPYQGKKLIEKLDKSIKRVGVFVNSPMEEVKKIANICDLDILQFHGEESPGTLKEFQQQVWKAFRIKDDNSFKKLDNYSVEGYLLDTFVEGEEGGTGRIFDWQLIPPIQKKKFFILAGGLTVENIERAIKQVKPKVVDVSSGVEVNGYKDFNKMKKFIEKVRR